MEYPADDLELEIIVNAYETLGIYVEINNGHVTGIKCEDLK